MRSVFSLSRAMLLVGFALMFCVNFVDADVLTPASSVDQILDELHKVGKDLKDFSADVSNAEVDSLNGETTTLSGKVWYQSRNGDGRIRVTFDKKIVVDKAVKNFKQEYLLENGWLTDRNYIRKIEVQRQVLKPGQKMNLLKLGEGPFPLPIGQEPVDVMANFELKKIDTKTGDPAAAIHLQLTPKPKSPAGLDRKFKVIDAYIDMKTGFPRRIETTNNNESESRITDLTNVHVNTGLSDKDFSLEKIEGWKMTSETF